MQPYNEEKSEEEKEEKLDQDFEPPFSPAEDIKNAGAFPKKTRTWTMALIQMSGIRKV